MFRDFSEVPATLVASGVSCMVASGVLNPIDVAKARMQLSQLSSPPSLRSTLHALWINERVPGLLRGLGPSMLREIANSLRIGSYDYFRRRFSTASGESTSMRRLAAGLCAGLVGSFAGNPFDIVKVRFHASTPGVNRPAAYTSTWTTLAHMYNHEGGFVSF